MMQNNERGLSIVAVMMVMALSAIIISGVSKYLSSHYKAERLNAAIDEAQATLTLITKEVRNRVSKRTDGKDLGSDLKITGCNLKNPLAKCLEFDIVKRTPTKNKCITSKYQVRTGCVDITTVAPVEKRKDVWEAYQANLDSQCVNACSEEQIPRIEIKYWPDKTKLKSSVRGFTGKASTKSQTFGSMFCVKNKNKRNVHLRFTAYYFDLQDSVKFQKKDEIIPLLSGGEEIMWMR